MSVIRRRREIGNTAASGSQHGVHKKILMFSIRFQGHVNGVFERAF